MPYTQEKYQRAKEALSSGTIPPDKVPVVQSKIAEFESDQARGYKREPEADEPITVLENGPSRAPNAQGYDIDLSRPDAVVLQPGETPGSLRLKKLKEQFQDRKLPNASKLKVYSEPAEYSPPPKPQNPFSPMSAQAFGMEDAGHSKYFREPTVEQFRNDVAKSPELQARLQKDFPALKSNLMGDVDDNQLGASETFLAYQDSRWRMALADAMKRGAPLYRVAYSEKLSPEEKTAAEAADMGNAVLGGVGQAATIGLLDPVKQAINPQLAEEGRQERQRNPGSDVAGQIVGGAVGLPRLVFGGLASAAKPLGKAGKYLPTVAAGAGTNAIDDSSRQIGQIVAESLDAHDSALEGLARLQDQFSPMQALTSGAIGGAAAGAGQLLANAAHGLGKGIVSAPGRIGPINENIATGGKMGYGGGIKVEPELESLRSLASRAGTNAEEAVSSRAANSVIKSQRLAQEEAARLNSKETEAFHEAMKRPMVKNGSISMGADELPTGPTAQRIRDVANGLPNYSNEDSALRRKLLSFADKVAGQKSVSIKEFDKLEASVDQLAKNSNPNGAPHETWQQVAKVVRDLRDEFKLPEEATIVDRPPEFAVRNAKGEEKVVGDYSGLNVSHKKRLDKLEFENRALGIPHPERNIPVSPRKAVELDVLDDGAETGGLLDRKHRDTISAVQDLGPEMNVDPETQAAVASKLREAASAPDIARGRDAILRALERSGADTNRLFDVLRKAKARGGYESMLGQVANGLSIGPHGMGNKFLGQNNLLRLVPTLKGVAGGRPTPPRVEATPTLEAAIDELLGTKKAAPSMSALASEKSRAGEEIMDKFVPELGGGLFNLGGYRLPAVAQGNRQKGQQKSVLAQLSPKEQKLLVEIIGNLAEMNPEAAQ